LHVYRRPFDYAVRQNRAPYLQQSVNLSVATFSFVAQPFTIDIALPSAGYVQHLPRVGVFRKRWDYAERYNHSFVQFPNTLTFSAATINFVAQPFSISAAEAPNQGSHSRAPERRVGVYRRHWNYAERGAVLEITWVEQEAFTAVNLTRATISFQAKPWTFIISPPVELRAASLTFVPKPWTLSGGGTVVNVRQASLLFTSQPWEINPGQNTVNLTAALLSIQPQPFDIVFAPPSIATVAVRAFKTGFFGGQLREVGAVFNITSPFQFSPYWMTLVGSPPDDWLPFLEMDAKPSVVRDIIKVPTEAEAVAWVDTGEFP
jgi:hypothetical protein